jgi:hypothetical protein
VRKTLNVLTDSLNEAAQKHAEGRLPSAPSSAPSATVRQLLVHLIKLINRRTETGRTTRFIKVRAHRGEPLNELADALASEAAESDPVRSIALDQDPEAVYFNLNGTRTHMSKRTWFSELQGSMSLTFSN